jgi:hypothetical protein
MNLVQIMKMLDCDSEFFMLLRSVEEPKIKIYEIIILPVVLCGCETWSFTLNEKHEDCFENVFSDALMLLHF